LLAALLLAGVRNISAPGSFKFPRRAGGELGPSRQPFLSGLEPLLPIFWRSTFQIAQAQNIPPRRFG